MIKRFNRFGIKGLLFITGLFVASLVMLNITDVVSRVRKEESGLNRYKYNVTLGIKPGGSFDAEFISKTVPEVFSLIESVNCNTILEVIANIEFQSSTFTLKTVMHQSEDLKLVSRDNKPISTDYPAGSNSVVIGESIVDLTENHEGEILNIGGNRASVEAVMKKTGVMADTNVYAFWDSFDEQFREYIIGRFEYPLFSVSFFGDSPVSDEVNAFSAALGELGLTASNVNQSFNGNDMENVWYRLYNQILLPIGIFFAVVVCLSSSLFWIMSRKNEISIRKAYGYSNSQIFGLIIKDELRMTLPAIAAAITVQFIFCAIWGTLDFFDALFPIKLAGAAAGMFLMTLLCAAYLTKSIKSISPAEAIKEV